MVEIDRHARRSKRRVLVGAAAGLVATALIAPAASAQPRRSVTVLPELPDRPEPAPVAGISQMRIDVLNTTVKAENAAGVSVDLIPGLQVAAGSKIGFRISTKRPGYVILLDVDAAGRLTQIFPNPTAVTRGASNIANSVQAARPLILPGAGKQNAGFEFIAEPPSGIAMVVALLSDKPVQVVDLPDAPPPGISPSDSLATIRENTMALKVPSENGSQLVQPHWSFDVKFYLIK